MDLKNFTKDGRPDRRLETKSARAERIKRDKVINELAKRRLAAHEREQAAARKKLPKIKYSETMSGRIEALERRVAKLEKK